MLDWLSPWAFLQTMARVAVVWLAFYGTGKLLRGLIRVDRFFPLLPSEIVGLLTFVVLTIPLSLLGIMNRTVCPVLLILMAIPGTLFAFGALKDRMPFPKPGLWDGLLTAFLVFVLLLNFTHASMPNYFFDDPLITYAVQPDRWLNRGRIYWLEETTFSGFPLLYEMTAVWPASLSSDRINQLSVLQVFQMSMLALALFRGLIILKVRRNLWPPIAATVLLTTALCYIISYAKTDAMALLFCTLALASAVRQRRPEYSGSPLSSWLFMGMALASKQTSALILAPFLLYAAGGFLKSSLKWKAFSLMALLAVPGAYGVRTMLKTGSPTYPVNPVGFLLREGWTLEDPVENYTINDRTSYLHAHRTFPLAKHIGIFFAYMEGNILLLLAGILSALAVRKWGLALLAIPFFVYCILAIRVFWPPWWGVKYTILIFPFIAILGGKMLEHARWGRGWAALVLSVSFVIPGFVAVATEGMPFRYRWSVATSIFQGRWNEASGYRFRTSTPEGMTQMWANSAFPPETVIFSILEEKRYFFDGAVVVGWRHPLGQKLYLDNTLEEELAILDSLDVDLVGFYRNDPAPLDQEDRLAILDHIGMGELFEPVIIINGDYLLCRYNR